MEKEMILSNPNVMMRLQRMLQAQKEFDDAVAYELENLENTKERNHYGTPVLMPALHEKGKKSKARPKKEAAESTFQPPQFSRNFSKKASVLWDE
jgi:hypothetical protein